MTLVWRLVTPFPVEEFMVRARTARGASSRGFERHGGPSGSPMDCTHEPGLVAPRRQRPRTGSSRARRGRGPQVATASCPPKFDQSPQSGGRSAHIGQKENAEHDHHGIEELTRVLRSFQVTVSTLCVRQVEEACFLLRQRQRFSARSTATTRPVGPTWTAAGIAEAPAPAHTSRTEAPEGSLSRSTVARPKRSQNPKAWLSKNSAAAL
jgi:hypothetical protein